MNIYLDNAATTASDGENVRFSFSKYNSLFEIDTVVRAIAKVF